MLNGRQNRKQNTGIASKDHNLITLTTNKLCLSSFDNKLYICYDNIKTLPFGHFCIDWEGINLSDWSFQSDNIASIVNSVDWTEEMNEEGGFNVDIFTPPDLSFNKRQYASAELQQTADLEAETDKESTPTSNPFLDLEAIESSEEIPQSKKPRTNFHISVR